MLCTMCPALDDVAPHRLARLAPKLAEKSYRDSYVSMQLRVWLADQVRALRGDMTQAEFGKLIGKPQTVVSRLEDPNYGRLTVETLLEVASKLDIALLVRFVDHATFLMATNDFSESALRPAPYSQAGDLASHSRDAMSGDCVAWSNESTQRVRIPIFDTRAFSAGLFGFMLIRLAHTNAETY